MPDVYSQQGAMGCWMLMCPGNFLPTSPEPSYQMRCETTGLSVNNGGGRIADFRCVPLGSGATFLPGGDHHVDFSDYKIVFRYYPSTSDPTGSSVSVETGSLSDSSVGKIIANTTVEAGTIWYPRAGIYAVFEWVITYKFSTWLGGTGSSAYADDGYAKLYLNGSLILQHVDVKIPRRTVPIPGGVKHSYGTPNDLDRIWGRTSPIIWDNPGSSPPADLLFYYDFEDGLMPSGWQQKPTTFGGILLPNFLSDCGDGGAGVSAYTFSPFASHSGSSGGDSYNGIAQITPVPHLEITPPVPTLAPLRVSQMVIDIASPVAPGPPPSTPLPPPVTTGSDGLYFIDPLKAERHDSYYGDIEKKIPNPTVRTALFGE